MSGKRIRRAGASLALLMGSVVLVACGGNGATATDSSSSKTGASSSGAAEGALNVALSEWTVKPSSAAVKSGNVEVKITNNGTTPHELMIVKTDVAHDKLEQAAGIADEAKYKPLARSKQLNGAASENLEAELTPGKYVLLCNISGHYGLGMHAPLTVN